MAVGKGSIQRATRALQEDNKDKAVFTEAKTEEAVIGESKPAAKKTAVKKAAEDQPVAKKPAAKKTAVKKAAEDQPVAKKTAAKKTAAKKAAEDQPAAKKPAAKKAAAKKSATATKKTASDVEPKKDIKRTYEQISHIKSDLPVHLL